MIDDDVRKEIKNFHKNSPGPTAISEKLKLLGIYASAPTVMKVVKEERLGAYPKIERAGYWKGYLYRPIAIDCYTWFNGDYQFSARFLHHLGCNVSHMWVYQFWESLGLYSKNAGYDKILEVHERSNGNLLNAVRILKNESFPISAIRIKSVWVANGLKYMSHGGDRKSEKFRRKYAPMRSIEPQ